MDYFQKNHLRIGIDYQFDIAGSLQFYLCDKDQYQGNLYLHKSLWDQMIHLLPLRQYWCLCHSC